MSDEVGDARGTETEGRMGWLISRRTRAAAGAAASATAAVRGFGPTYAGLHETPRQAAGI